MNASGKILKNTDAEGSAIDEMVRNFDKINLGKHIRSQRIRVGLTQQELAEKVNLSVKSISCIERGINYPSPENLFDIAKVLDMSIDMFLFGYKKFNVSVNMSEINANLELLTCENQLVLINVVEAVTQALLSNQKTANE